MNSFLEKVVSYIISSHDMPLDSTAFIVPNQRTGLFIKKYLAEAQQKTMLLPCFYTIDEFAQSTAKIKKADNITLLTDLYSTYCTHLKKTSNNVYSIDDFTTWGGMLLADFSDIDASMADAKEVFSYLSEAKAIASWNLNEKPLTPFQKNYLHFYNSLFPIYKDFTSFIIKKGYAYQTHIFRYIAENKKMLEESIEKESKFFFIGFNALTKAEEHIVDFFINNKKADFCYDYDQFYLENSDFEAGLFVRNNIKKYGISPFHEENINFRKQEKNIKIIGVPKNVGQAKLAGLILKQKFNTENIEKTALILPKEELLFPILNSIPDEVNDINITMGYPLEKTLIYDFFESIIALFENAFRINKLKGEARLRINIKDFLSVIENPHFIHTFSNKNKFYSFIKHLKTNNKVFYTSEELLEIVKTYTEETNRSWESIQNLALHSSNDSIDLAKLIKTILSNLTINYIENGTTESNKHSFELDFMFHYSKIINKLITFLENADSSTVKSFKFFHKMLLNGVKIPFSGEPLKGLQIMGFLESRNLDFENIIILSTNEGVLPSAKQNNSFIPFDIRKHFKMSLYKENEAIYAYHFYSIIQRAKNIYLLYNTEHDELGGGEKSRYITQIQNELTQSSSAVVFSESIIHSSVLTDTVNTTVSINKNKDVLNLLFEKAKKGLSPTSISVFIQCPLRFYFQYLMNFKAEDDIEENIDAALLGSVIHEVLENLYKPLIGKELSSSDLNVSENIIENNLRNAFSNNMKNADVNFGKNHLLLKIAIKYIKNFLQNEINTILYLEKLSQKIRLIGTEKELRQTLKLDADNLNDVVITLSGKIDRIDEVNNQSRIIDYKTGRIEPRDLQLNDWDELSSNTISSKVIQLLIYGYLYFDENKNTTIEPGFISLRHPERSISNLKLPDGQTLYTEEVHKSVAFFLNNLFKTMFDANTPFNQTENKENCKYCDFINICNRQ